MAPDIEEPTAQATRENMHLDQDIKGVKGSPDLARTILDKIDASAVVVADVTLVGRTRGEGSDSKRLINSNVAIELGYASRALGDEYIILVFNAHYGAHEDLPFDLRHKGGAVVFDLPPDADRQRIDREQKRLTAQFIAKLRPYLDAATAAAAPSFQETPTSYSKATYFNQGQVLAEIGEAHDFVDFGYEAERFAYIRLIPTAALSSPIPLASLKQAVKQMPLLSPNHGSIQGHNNYGAIAYEPGSNPPKGRARLAASTQLFQNGEFWSISAKIIITDRGHRPASIRLPCIHSLTFEQIFYDTLHRLISSAASHLALTPPWQVELGLVGVNDAYIIGMLDDEQWGPIRKTEVIERIILNETSPDAIDAALLRFYEKVYDATGYARPSCFHGFPPSPPASRRQSPYHWPGGSVG